jgi:hypothetical protein
LKQEGHGGFFYVYKWIHEHFPNVVDCRLIFIAPALQEAGFGIQKEYHLHI